MPVAWRLPEPDLRIKHKIPGPRVDHQGSEDQWRRVASSPADVVPSPRRLLAYHSPHGLVWIEAAGRARHATSTCVFDELYPS
jgi:hypothetical protein